MISEKFYNYKKFLNILKRLLDVLRCENCEKQAKKKSSIKQKFKWKNVLNHLVAKWISWNDGKFSILNIHHLAVSWGERLLA